jgi:hypothetical protein
MRSFPNRPRGKLIPRFTLPNRLTADIQDFLQEYPGTPENPSLKANLNFYKDKQAMRPDKRTFTVFMEDVEGDYDELEMNQ